MKNFLFISLISAATASTSSACTTFFISKNGQMVFGRNYDWITATGMVCTNLRGLQKTSMATEDGKTISWAAEYGSITFNQYGKEFPNGGMNEKGLVVELMWLDGTKYPKPDNRPAVNVLQWIQYQLDRSATMDDVIASDKVIRITSKGTPLHYLVADAGGHVATIEFLDGKMVVHRGEELPFAVLTNSTYDASIFQTKGAANNRAFADNSIDRFAKACNMVQQYQLQDTNEPIVDYAFNILNKVSQNNWTKWSIVYDITNKKISFKSNSYPEIKTVAFSSFNFSCTSSPKMLSINDPGKGEISNSFKDFSINDSKPLLDAAVNESKDEITISEETKQAVLNYSKEIKCK
jgi:penicillin V acylase-like amidase (Ntn superfamily)